LLVSWSPGSRPVELSQWVTTLAALRDRFTIEFREVVSLADLLRARAFLSLSPPVEYPAIAAEVAETGTALVLPASSALDDVPLGAGEHYLKLPSKDAEDIALRLDSVLKSDTVGVKWSWAIRDKLNSFHTRFWNEATAAREFAGLRPRDLAPGT